MCLFLNSLLEAAGTDYILHFNKGEDEPCHYIPQTVQTKGNQRRDRKVISR